MTLAPRFGPGMTSHYARSFVKRPLALLLCAALLFAAGCDKTTTRPAATVNDQPIATQSLVDELNAIAGNTDYLNALSDSYAQRCAQQPTQPCTKVKGDTPGSFDAAFAASTLRDQIIYRLIRTEVEKQNLKADDACKAAGAKDVYTSIGAGDVDKGKATFEKFPKAYQDTLLSRDLDTLVLQAHLAAQECVPADAAKAYYDAHPDEFTQTCFSLILSQDQAGADKAEARLKAGEDFATVAKSESLDTTSAAKGGDFGCQSKGTLPTVLVDPVFATAPGTTSAPLAVAGGFVILKVTDRKAATLEESRSQAEEVAASTAGQAFQEFVRQAVTSATVTIDPRYGTFNKDTFSIDPPGGAATTTTTLDSVPPTSTP